MKIKKLKNIRVLLHIIFLVVLATLVSCKSKAVIAEATATKKMSADKIVSNHYAVKKEFKTAYIKADVSYKDDKQSLNVSADIRIKKNEQILLSLRFFGITMAKALITPKEVKYYEKSGNKYFEGDYTTLSKWLGTDLDFNKVQNMLIGQAFDDLNDGKYDASIEDGFYKLNDKSNKNTEKAFFFEASQFLIKKQEISQKSKNRMLKVSYPSHKDYPEVILPTQLIIEALQDNTATKINIEYKSATFNEELSFPYSVPDGFDRIFID
ncbi:hypothetical protein J2X31_002726 [Flavobacterium arsenatis]|uniref:DUF4292 domain-containing protein n=1 Tax=Flavobacterium arsenatis TaxID=1484332 RepID=A0ABU1TS49_9FLAO|nr:DUF4292 domain-containing protein [Flavobacterium arsenatis]MDR6968700.1 hypothetical protein [Flavobacterium arsenatis]